MKPSQILDCRNDLSIRLETNGQFRRQCAFMIGGHLGDHPLNGQYAMKASDSVEARMPVVDTFARYMKVAEVYRVSEDMSMMLEFAASQLDETDQLDTSLAPTGCGLVRLDKPLPVTDGNGATMLINWLLWGPFKTSRGQTGIAVLSFNDTVSDPDEIHGVMMDQIRGRGGKDVPTLLEEYQQYVGRFATCGFDMIFTGQKVGPRMLEPTESLIQEYLEQYGKEPVPGTNPVRYIHALWLLLGQTVTRTEKAEIERHARRRAEKMRLPSKVTVIRLRREAGEGRQEGESMVEWAHRWVVRGHWRWQVVGPHHEQAQEIEPGKYRARIWINPYVKGPEDAPFVQSEKVYSLER